MNSDIPEEVILGILSNFEGKKPSVVIGKIVARLNSICKDRKRFKIKLRQLTVLSELPKLADKVEKQIKRMPLTIDINETYLYKKGKEEGKREGKKVGKREGKKVGEKKGEKNKERELILALLEDGTLTNEKIASLAKVSIDYVRSLAKELSK